MSNPTDGRGRNHTVYGQADVEAMKGEIQFALGLWKRLCAKWINRHGDVGRTVKGAGIKIMFRYEGEEEPEEYMLIDAHDAAHGCKGSCTWEWCYWEALQALREDKIDCWYDFGKMRGKQPEGAGNLSPVVDIPL